MAGSGQLVAWLTLAAAVIAARLLDTGPGRRLVRARISQLANWWAARQPADSEIDQERAELAAVLRRQRLTADVARLRRIVATDESMSATRQIANRLAYRWLVHELERTPIPVPWLADDDSTDRWAPATYNSRQREPEVLEIGWR